MSPRTSISDSSEVSDSDSRSSSTQPMSISPTSPVETGKTLVQTTSHSSSKLGDKLSVEKTVQAKSAEEFSAGVAADQATQSRHSTDLATDIQLKKSPEHHGKYRIEPDPESCVSDVSEMADSIKEHLANVQIIRKEDLEAGNTMCLPEFVVQQRILRKPGETDEEFAKRIRKINYLSLAQEFAELKKADSQALPFDLHKANPEDIASPSSDTSSSTDVEDTCDSELPTPCDSHKDFAEAIMATESLTQASSLSTRLETLNVSPKVRSDVDLKGPAGSTKPNNSTHNKNTKLDAQNQNLNCQYTTKGKDSSAIDNSSRKTDTTKHVAKSDSPHTKHREHTSNQRSTPKAERRQKSQSTMLTKTGGERTGSQRKSLPSAQELNDFDVYNIETALPQMDWAALEQQLKQAAEEEQQKLSRRNDREAIRQKLAMAGPEEEYYGGERMAKKPNLQTRLQSGMNLQLCYVNDVAGEQEAAATADKLATPVPNQMEQPGPSSLPPAVEQPVSRDQAESVGAKKKDEDFMSRQARLQDEARMALAQVRPMAHMQLEIEKQLRKKSPIAEMVGQGQIKGAVPGLGDRKKRLTRPVMQDMNFAQLQVIVNDLHTQIENLNEELVRLLVDRDDLHMEQDSMLVDIEDLTRRAQEVSSRVSQRSGKKSSSAPGKR